MHISDEFIFEETKFDPKFDPKFVILVRNIEHCAQPVDSRTFGSMEAIRCARSPHTSTHAQTRMETNQYVHSLEHMTHTHTHISSRTIHQRQLFPLPPFLERLSAPSRFPHAPLSLLYTLPDPKQAEFVN